MVKPDRQLYEVAVQTALIERLASVPEVSRYDGPDWLEAEVLVHAFTDLEDSFREYLNGHLPRLLRTTDPDEFVDVLLDIGEEFRHILYHLEDPKYYAYLRREESSE